MEGVSPVEKAICASFLRPRCREGMDPITGQSQAGRAKKYLRLKGPEAISIASVHRTHENGHG